MKQIKTLILGIIIGILAGLWFGVNIGKGKPILSNPFSDKTIQQTIKKSGDILLEKSGEALEKSGKALKEKVKDSAK